LVKPEFNDFLSRSSLVVERILGREETYDIFVDYGGQGRGEGKGRSNESISRLVQVGGPRELLLLSRLGLT
jgi:hypothetical protein